MENQGIENMDIERNKELFEYEMTQVLIQLKGEFAAISGKDVNFAGSAAEENIVEFSPISIPEVELDKNNITAPETVKISAVEIPEIKAESINLSAPETEKFAVKDIPQVNIGKSTAELPEIPAIRAAEDTAAAVTVSGNIEKIKINTVSADIKEGLENNLFRKTEDIKISGSEALIPEIPQINIKGTADITVKKPDINIPETIKTDIAVTSEGITAPEKIKLPTVKNMSVKGSISAPAVNISIHIPDTALPDIPGLTVPAEMPQVRSKEEDEKTARRIKELMKMEIPRPEIPDNLFSFVSAGTENIEVPEKPDVEAAKEEILKTLSIS